MAIDNRIDAFKKAYPDESNPPKDLALFATKLILPEFVLTALDGVLGRIDRKLQDQRAKDMLELFVNELKDLKNETASKQELQDVQEALQLAIRHDVWEFNDKKRERYIKIIANTLRSDTRIEDLASFIQDVEQLGERDFIALKVLNKVMNKKNDWTGSQGTTVHPGLFIQRRDELASEMATALGNAPTKQAFSREEGYEACTRLQGFGLAHEIDVAPRQVPIGDYSFRPSKRGLTLLRLVGEEVENWNKYFPGLDQV